MDSVSATTSSEPPRAAAGGGGGGGGFPAGGGDPVAASQARILAVYAQILWGGGAVLTLAILGLDIRWVSELGTVGLLAAATVALRAAPVRLSKYSYLPQSGIVALVGALIAAPASTVLALGIGVLASDILFLRKPVRVGGINAGREVLAFASAYGLYVAALDYNGVTGITLDYLPAAAAFLGGYFFISRLLFYFTLLLRAKLTIEERLFILRWEIVSYGATVLAAAIVTWSLVNLAPAGWPAVAIALGVMGVLTRTLIEEAIAAEDLNKVHQMQAAVLSTSSLHSALGEIERLAYRLVDWGDLTIHRFGSEGDTLLYRAVQGRPGRGGSESVLAAVREEVKARGVPVVIPDAYRDPRIPTREAGRRSIVLYPLRLSDETIGTLEIEHHKRHSYRDRDLAAISALAAQIATAIHLAELRRPLLRTVEQVKHQVQLLVRASQAMRGSAGALGHASDNMRRKIASQESFAEAGLVTTHQMIERATENAGAGQRAAEASRGVADAAEKHRLAMGEAIDRLVQLETFVADTAAQVSGLGAATGRITEFIGSIREIAEATNLIALNAAIEAARAGVEGRGFGVVADEIRDLAVQSAAMTAEAGKLVRDVAGEVRGIMAQMELGRTVVEGIGEVSSEAARAITEIVRAALEAGREAGAIDHLASDQARESRRLEAQIRQVAAAVQEARADSEQLAAQAGSAKRGQAELDAAIGELEHFAAHLQAIAKNLAVET